MSRTFHITVEHAYEGERDEFFTGTDNDLLNRVGEIGRGTYINRIHAYDEVSGREYAWDSRNGGEWIAED